MDLKSKSPEEIKYLIESQMKEANVNFLEVDAFKGSTGTSFTVHVRKFYVIVFGEINVYLDIPAGLEEYERTDCEVRQIGPMTL